MSESTKPPPAEPAATSDDPRMALAVLRALPQAVALVEAPSGRLLLANARMEALVRVPLGSPDARQQLHAQFRLFDGTGRELALHETPGSRAIRGEVIQGELVRIQRADGSEAWVRAWSQPNRDASGAITTAIVMYEDVTEHERVLAREQAARSAAELGESDFRALAELIPQLVWTRGADLAPEFANARLREYLGAPVGPVDLASSAAVHPGDAAGTQARMSAAHSAGEAYELELRLRRASDGQYRWFLVRGVPLRAADGRVARWFGTATDIHEQKQLEIRSRFLSEASAELARSLDHEVTLRRMAELGVPTFADWIMVDLLGPDESIRRVAVAHADPQLAELGWKRAREVPMQLSGPAGVARVLRTGAPLVVEDVEEVIRAGDAALQATLRALGLRTWITAPMLVRGRAVGAITFGVASEERRYGAADLELACELARRAATALENATLLRDAQAANRAKDEFLAVVSHELRTPLTAVLGYTSMLRAGTLSEERRVRAIEVIDRNVRAQAQLIEDLLDISRIITGKIRLHVRPSNLAEVVDAALDAVRPGAEAKGIHLSTALDRDAGLAHVDPDRMQQVVWNLLANAIKFTPAGGRVTVALAVRERALELSVRDSGVGISPAFLPFMFERFRQADPSSTRAHGGLGLGLAIVQHVVELHGGQVRAESEGENRGATFHVRLPLAVPAVSDARPLTPPGAPTLRPELPELRGRRLLVVDDSQDARDMLAAVLERAGAAVTAVSSAAEGMAALGRARFDGVISDIGMPEVDGYTFVRKLRALPHDQGGATPALALTAYAREEDRAQALAAGFQQHLAKPVVPAELVHAVAALLRR